MANRRALVTGATGYIASHLIPALVADGWEVLATGRRREPPALPDGVDYASVDLVKDDPWAFSGLMESVTHVFHLAGASSSLSDQEEMERTNVLGTRRILAASKGWPIERFVHMSSTSVYGEEVELPSPVPEDVDRHPSRGYGKAKDGAERVVEEYAARGTPTVVVRPVTVYGPGNVKLLASTILDVAVERFAGLDRIAVAAEPIEQRLVHVDDVVAASIHLATADDAVGRAFNVVLPQYPSSHEVAGMVADAFALPVELVADPDPGLAYEARTRRPRPDGGLGHGAEHPPEQGALPVPPQGQPQQPPLGRRPPRHRLRVHPDRPPDEHRRHHRLVPSPPLDPVAAVQPGAAAGTRRAPRDPVHASSPSPRGSRLGGDVARTIPSGWVTSKVASGRSLACHPGWWRRWWWRVQTRTRLVSSVGPPWVTQRTWWPSHHVEGRSQPGKRHPSSRMTSALHRGAGMVRVEVP